MFLTSAAETNMLWGVKWNSSEVNQPYLTGVGSSLQVSCTDHPGGDKALVNLRLIAGLCGEEWHHRRAQDHTGLS